MFAALRATLFLQRISCSVHECLCKLIVLQNEDPKRVIEVKITPNFGTLFLPTRCLLFASLEFLFFLETHLHSIFVEVANGRGSGADEKTFGEQIMQARVRIYEACIDGNPLFSIN